MIPFLILAALGAVAYAASQQTPSTATPSTPGTPGAPLDARARLPQSRASGPCVVVPGEVSLLDVNALLSWAACDVRTAEEVAAVLVRLAEQARAYPEGGYEATAETLRTQWNQRMETEERQATPARSSTSRTPASPRASRTSTSTRAQAQAYDEAKRRALGVPQAPNATRTPPAASRPATQRASAGAELEAELTRAESILPGARARYRAAMQDATPSELRAAADQIEDRDPSFVAIPRALRARAAQRDER
jgi:hypothetical protein